MAFTLDVNGKSIEIDADPGTPLLWVLRDHAGLTGTKFGCGIARCGACTVHVNGQATRSCSIPAAKVVGQKITTIEGLAEQQPEHPVFKAWKEIDVVQCGYCQTGQIMAATALLAARPKPTDADIDQAMDNVCRCGTYLRIRAAVKRAAELA